MAKYLVTGGAGFIGSNIVEYLVKHNHEVVVIDNFFSGRRENIEPFLGDIRLFEGDINDGKLLAEALPCVDFVFHEAAIPSVQRSVDKPVRSNTANIDGTLNILAAANEFGVKRVVFAGSSSVYGDTPVLPKEESMPLNPMSPYAVTKAAGEMYFKVFASLYDVETVVIRYFNVFGPRQDPSSHYSAVIPKFIRLLLEDSPPTIHGSGEQSRDFTYIDNVVHANILATEAPADKVSGKVFNVACGSRIDLNELVQVLNEIMGKNIKPIHGDPKPGDVKHSLAAIERAKECMGYEPLVTLREGLKKTIEHLKAECR